MEPLFSPILTKSQTGIEWQIFKLRSAILIWNSTYVGQILCDINYTVCSTFITTFRTIKLFILILDISVIIHQSPCCYVVTISKIGPQVKP